MRNLVIHDANGSGPARTGAARANAGPSVARLCRRDGGLRLFLAPPARRLLRADVASVEELAQLLEPEDACGFRQAVQALTLSGQPFDAVVCLQAASFLRISGCPDPSEEGSFLLHLAEESWPGASAPDDAKEPPLPVSPDLSFARLLCAIESAPFGFALYDENDRLQFGNRIFRRVLPVPLAETLVGKTFAEIAALCLANGCYEDADGPDYLARRIRQHRDADGMIEQFLSSGTIERIIERRTASGGWVGVHVDITELSEARARATQAESEAQRMRDRLAMILDLLPDALIVYDTEDRVLLANREYLRLYENGAQMLAERARFEDVLRRTYEKGEYGDPAQLPPDFLDRRLRAHRCEEPSFTFTMHNGKTVRIVERQLPDGGIVGLHVDLTAVHSAKTRAEIAEAEAKLAQERLQTAIEGMSDGFVIFDADDRLVLANSRYLQMNASFAPVIAPGVAFADILRFGLERGLFKSAIGQEEVWFAERMRQHVEGGASFDEYLADGTVRRCRDNRTPDHGHVGVQIDVSEVVRARDEAEIARQAALTASAQLQNAIGRMQDGFAFWDVDERLVLCNQRYREIYPELAPILKPGVTFEKMLRSSLAAGLAFGREEAGEDWINQTLRAWRSGESAIVMTLADGRMMRVYDRFTPGIGTVSVHVDITELVQARQEAEAANRTKSMFLAQMSHEIRTPLTGILGLAQVLEDEVPEGPARQHARNITRSGETLLAILNDVLDMAKIEIGKIEVEQAPFDPANLAQRLAVIYAPQAAERKLVFHNASILPVKARLGDAHRIMQVMNNLLSNALKFTPSGQVVFSVSDTPDNALLLTVEDTGIGMSTDTLARMFRPFEQADVSITRRYGGTGLGMSIVHQLVSLMGGTIVVSSVLGSGTCVRVTLPLPEVPDTPVPAPAPEVTGETLQARVLVADDNSIIRDILFTLLTRMGCSVQMAEDGGQAIDAFGAASFDMVLLDISMPVMNGQEVLQAMADMARKTGRPMPPCVAITANSMKHQVEDYLASGFAAHIAKPFHRSDLEQILRRFVSPVSADQPVA